MPVVRYWTKYRGTEYNHEKPLVIWSSHRVLKEPSPGNKLETVPFNPFCSALRLLDFDNSARMSIIMDNIHPSLHPQILFDLTWKVTMGNEYLLFELCSNGKQLLGECTLATRHWQLLSWESCRKGRYNEFLGNRKPFGFWVQRLNPSCTSKIEK